MKAERTLLGQITRDALWLWLTLILAIGLATGATAIAYSLGAKEDSAMKIGFAAIVATAVSLEVIGRVIAARRPREVPPSRSQENYRGRITMVDSNMAEFAGYARAKKKKPRA